MAFYKCLFKKRVLHFFAFYDTIWGSKIKGGYKNMTEENRERAEIIREARRARVASYVEKELGDTIANESEMTKESNKQVDELSPQFYTKNVSPRMHEIHAYYARRTAAYSLAGAMVICGAAAALAPWSLPFVLTGAGVAITGGVVGVGTRLARNDNYNVSLDFATAQMAARQRILQNSIERDIDFVAIGEKKGTDVEYIRQRAEKKLDRLEKATIKAYNKASRKIKKFDQRQISFQKNAVSGRASMWSSFLGIKRWTNRDEKIRARLDNDMYLNIAELIKINNARCKLGLPISTQADSVVKKHEAEVIESAENAAKQRFDRAESNAAQNQKTLEDHKTTIETKKQVYGNEFAKRLHKPSFTDRQVAQFLAPPCNIEYPRAFEILMNENFGMTDGNVDFAKKQNYPIFPKVKDWETGEVEMQDGKIVLTTYKQMPKFGYAPLVLSMSCGEVEKLFEPYEFDPDKFYQVIRVKGEKVEIYMDSNKTFVVKQPTDEEIRTQRVYGKKMEIKPQFLHPVVRDNAGIPQFNNARGTLKVEDEYEMVDIEPADIDIAWPEVVTKDGKLVRCKNFDGSLSGYQTKEGVFYSEKLTSKVESRKKAALVGIILKNASEEEIKEINKIFNGLTEEQKDILRNEEDFAKIAAKYRLAREGVDENIGVYDAFCSNVAAKKYQKEVAEQEKQATM